MPYLRHGLLLLLALLAFSGTAPAQQTASAADDRRAVDEALRNKAFDLLETLADQIGTLQSAENRARLASNLAALLWKHDERRARNLLASVQSDINLGLETVVEDEWVPGLTLMVFLKLRIDTVERIARHDAEAAFAFLKATEPRAELAKSHQVAEMVRSLEVQLASQIASENPEIALQLGRKSLARGFSHDLLPLLKLLHKKDKEKALSLYKEVVEKLVNTGLIQHSQTFYFAQALTRSFKPPLADDQTFRQLVNLFIDTAFRNGCHMAIEEGSRPFYFCAEIASLLPQMEKVDPSRAAELKKFRSEEWDSQYSPEAHEEVADVSQNGTVDQLLALAEKYPSRQHEIYWRAITKAEESGDLDRARKIATDHVDEPIRKEIIARLDRVQALQSLTPEKMGEIQTALSKIQNVRGRIGFLLQMANQFGAKDRKSALKLLNQASEIIDAMKPGPLQTEAELFLATMYCVEKDERGLDRMQSIMPKLNELVAAAVKLDGYDSHNVRDGEWNMSNQGSIGELLTALSQAGVYFAWCDFDRALNLAGQFERSEIRLMAQLKLAQAILAGPPKRPPFIPAVHGQQ